MIRFRGRACSPSRHSGRPARGCACGLALAALLGPGAAARAALVVGSSADGTLDSRPPVVQLARPAGGEQFAAAAAETLRWTVAEDLFAPGGRPVRLELWADGAVVWADSVAASFDSSYVHVWTVPDLRLPSARLIVSALDAVGLAGADTSAAFTVHNSLTAVPDGAPPARDALAPNAPNPFNPRTTLRFDLAAPAVVDLTVYDLAGRRVARLATGAWPAGRHAVAWDGRDDRGRDLPSGAYFARLRLDGAGRAGGVVRMTLVK